MAGRTWTPEMEEWLAREYPRRQAADLRAAMEREFGWCPSGQGIYMKAWKMGLSKEQRPGERGRRAARVVRWSSEPDMTAWMLEHDKGSVPATIDAFEAEFGIRLNRAQVSGFRSSHGTQQKRPHGGGRPRVPVGTERVTKDGYLLVKVSEESDVPQGKTNWRLKHVVEYEKAHGPLPEGSTVFMADGDRRNFDPENLVAVPRRLVALLNLPGAPRWTDAVELRACVALAELREAVHAAEMGGTRTCAVCGARFEIDERRRRYPKPVSTCPACLAAGFKARGSRRSTVPGTRRCAVCGAEFEPCAKSQRRCKACIDEAPRLSVEMHVRMRGGATWTSRA